MRKNELVHHEHYVAKVQQDLTHFLLNDESLKNGAIKYLRWDNEMKLFDVYEDAEHKVFITHTFYERFRDIQLAKGIVCQRCGRSVRKSVRGTFGIRQLATGRAVCCRTKRYI